VLLDEPAAALGVEQCSGVVRLIRKLKEDNHSGIVISTTSCLRSRIGPSSFGLGARLRSFAARRSTLPISWPRLRGYDPVPVSKPAQLRPRYGALKGSSNFHSG
jgi:hypothetical protein